MLGHWPDRARTAVREPSKVPPFLANKAQEQLLLPAARLRAGTASLPNQRIRLDDLRDRDEYLLVVLDACRADYFVELAPQYLKGGIDRLQSAGRDTFEYVARCWDRQYPDTTYVSAATPVNGRDLHYGADLGDLYDGEYRPRDHIGTIVDSWHDDWDESLGTVPPERCVGTALDYLDEDRLVVHLFQPHAPYIGSDRLLGHHDNDSATPGGGEPVDKPIWDRVRYGDLGPEQLHHVYRSNLQRALTAAAGLIRAAPHDHVVVMGDHGEALGEYGVYSHPKVDHPKIREIPWMRVDHVADDIPELSYSDLERETTTNTDASVSDRLEALGYL